MGTLTGVFDRRDGLEAVEGDARASPAKERAGGTMVEALSKSSIHSSMAAQYRRCKETYMKGRRRYPPATQGHWR